MSALISKTHVDTVCLPGTAHCCRYLLCGPEGFECGKHTGFKEYLDQRVAAGTMRAIGDNCPGLRDDSAAH